MSPHGTALFEVLIDQLKTGARRDHRTILCRSSILPHMPQDQHIPTRQPNSNLDSLIMEPSAGRTKRTMTARFQTNDFLAAVHYGSGTEQSNPPRAANNSAGMDIVQPLSPTSFLTPSPEATASPQRESTNIRGQLATTPQISADSTLPHETRDSPLHL
jgi:hypothetical protein